MSCVLVFLSKTRCAAQTKKLFLSTTFKKVVYEGQNITFTITITRAKLLGGNHDLYRYCVSCKSGLFNLPDVPSITGYMQQCNRP